MEAGRGILNTDQPVLRVGPGMNCQNGSKEIDFNHH